MPYKLSAEGKREIERIKEQPKLKDNYTELQIKALGYFAELEPEEVHWVHAAEVAEAYGYPNGQWFRGVLASLHKKGLLIKDPREM